MKAFHVGLLLPFGWAAQQVAAQLLVDPMAPMSFCGSPTIPVSFSTPDVFGPDNVFTVELSDASGTFASPMVIGSAAGTVPGTIPCTFPAGIGGGGWAVRVVATEPPQIGAAYALPIATMVPPSAGANATIAVCSNEPPFNLYAQLGGSPQPGGTWTGPSGVPVSPVFTPGTSTPGCHSYTVAGLPPCAAATAVLCIAVSNAPGAGTNVSYSACGGPPIDMQAGLPPGGAWTYGGQPHSNIFVPGIDAPGPYFYTLPGTPPCAGVTHTAWMMVDVPPDAGTDATVNWCASFGVLDLFAQLGGTPDPGGTWTDDSATGALSGGTFDPAGVPSGTYLFTYTVPGGGVCPPAQASITVVNTAVCVLPPQSNFPVE